MTNQQSPERGLIARWLYKHRGPDRAELSARRAAAEELLNTLKQDLIPLRAEAYKLERQFTSESRLMLLIGWMPQTDFRVLGELRQNMDLIRDQIAGLEKLQFQAERLLKHVDWLALPPGERLVDALIKNPGPVASFVFLAWFTWWCATQFWLWIILKTLLLYIGLPWLALSLLFAAIGALCRWWEGRR